MLERVFSLLLIFCKFFGEIFTPFKNGRISFYQAGFDIFCTTNCEQIMNKFEKFIL